MNASFAVLGAQLIVGDGGGPLPNTAVIVTDGKIVEALPEAELPSDMAVTRFPGATVLPGLVNLHSHMVGRTGPIVSRVLQAAAKAKRDLTAGITTSRDLGAPDGLDVELRDAIADGITPGPELLVAARPITRTGGHNHAFSQEVDGPVEARRAVRQQLKSGADCIKMMASEGWNHAHPHRPGLSLEEMSAVVDEAHRLGLRVTVHAQGPRATADAIRAGVDSVEHATDGITDEVIGMFLDSGITLDSTSSSAWVVGRSEPGPLLSPRMIAAGLRQAASEAAGLARAVAAGVRITGATDMWGTMPVQYQLMLDAGMTPLDAIAGLTQRPAEVLGRADIGTVEPGRRADLLVLGSDPLSTPCALGNVTAVYRAGDRVTT